MDNKKLAIVTGATGAIGKAIARQLADRENYRVIMIARDEDKARKVLEDIQRNVPGAEISYRITDLSRRQQIRELAASVTGPVSVLINNAAFTPRARMETPEGIEMQFAANVLGYFWMMEAFIPNLLQEMPSRIVNVASYWAGGLDFSDLEFKRRHYNNDTAYRQSKQADRMLTKAFADMLENKGITVNACHPGDVNSALSNSMGYGGHESPDKGADTPVWLATGTELEGVTGKYFEHRRQHTCNFMKDTVNVERLFHICSKY